MAPSTETDLTARLDRMEAEMNGLCMAVIVIGVATGKPGPDMAALLRAATMMPMMGARECGVLVGLAEIFEASEPEAANV